MHNYHSTVCSEYHLLPESPTTEIFCQQLINSLFAFSALTLLVGG